MADQEEDPFSCFGSSSESETDDAPSSKDENDNHSQENSAKSGQRRVDQVNLRRAIAQKSVSFLPLLDINRFEVMNMAGGKGKGLVARKAYKTGDEIMRESAVMRVPNHQAASSIEEAEERHEHAVEEAFQRLNPLTQQAVLDLSANLSETQSRLVQLYQTNSYQLTGIDDEAYGGLFLTIARMNHSCCPNAGHFWREDLQATLVFATRDIRSGEEICTTYGFPTEDYNTAGRRSYLQDKFSFECHCRMCEQGNDHGGDDRMVDLQSLQNNIPVLAAEGKSREAIASIDRCLQLLEDQGFGRRSGAFVKSLLHQGYQVASNTSGDSPQDMDLAKWYLSEELVAVETGEGIGSPNAIQIQHMLDAMT